MIFCAFQVSHEFYIFAINHSIFVVVFVIWGVSDLYAFFMLSQSVCSAILYPCF